MLAKVGGASVARCPSRNRAYVRCLGGSSECNVVIVGTCVWPFTAEPCRAKTAPLPRSSILFRPHRSRPAREGEMVEAPGTAPGSETSMSRSVYRHSRFPDLTYIGASADNLKVCAPIRTWHHCDIARRRGPARPLVSRAALFTSEVEWTTTAIALWIARVRGLAEGQPWKLECGQTRPEDCHAPLH